MYQTQAIVERVRRVSGTVQRLEIAIDRNQRHFGAGQFFLAKVSPNSDPYLREPWIPIKVQGASVTIERPVTQTFIPGQLIDLLGPIGKPIPFSDTTRRLLLIAYDASPLALLMLAELALSKGAAVALALLDKASYYPLDALPPEIEILRGTGQTWANQAETFRWAEQIVAVAPPPFDIQHYSTLIKALREARVEIPSNYVYGLMQPPLPCGVGACMACLVRCGKHEIAACVDGVAFDLLTVSDVNP